jgi:hypothetical protein
MAKQTRQTLRTDTTSAFRTTGASTKPRSQPTPTEEQIRARAYQVYLRRRGGPGDASSDWKQAERELRQELST